MAKVRQDAWSHEDDLLLAETVLRHIREGSTQLDAFEEVGDRLNRTGAACGFRWNAIVRRKYDSAIEIAKKQRKQRKRAEQRMSRSYQPSYNMEMSSQLVDHDQDKDPSPSSSVDDVTTNEEQVMTGQHTQTTPSTTNELSMTKVISFLQNLQVSNQSTARLEKENNTLRAENEQLTKKITELEKLVGKLKKEHQTIEDDYQSLIGIMERARRMVMLSDQEDKGPSFKMDKNGNLEKLAK